jgi:hypothetical protein
MAHLSGIDLAAERACWMKTSTAGLSVRFLSVTTQVCTLMPGSVGIIPPNAVHSGRALTDCKILDVFSPVREDYIKFEDP